MILITTRLHNCFCLFLERAPVEGTWAWEDAEIGGGASTERCDSREWYLSYKTGDSSDRVHEVSSRDLF